MSLELEETYEEFGRDIEVFRCSNCGRTHTVTSGGDIACCPCEFENEGEGF